MKRHLTVVVCAAGPAADVLELVQLAQRSGWTVNVVATPEAVSFVDTPEVARRTGAMLRSAARSPGSPRHTGQVDAFIVAPATFNTVNKLAAGIADNYALTLLAEAIGAGIRVVVVPFVNSALAHRAPYQRALVALQDEGVVVLARRPHLPGTGEAERASFPWQQAWESVQ